MSCDLRLLNKAKNSDSYSTSHCNLTAILR